MSLNLLSSHISNPILNILDWKEVISEISKFAFFEYNQDGLSIPPKALSLLEMNLRYDAIDLFLQDFELNQQVIEQSFTSLPSDKKYNQVVTFLKKGRLFDIDQLNFLCLLFESFKILKKKFQHFSLTSDYYPKESEYNTLSKIFVTPFRKLVSTDGVLDYNGHPQLKKLYNELQQLEKHLRDDMAKISRSELYLDHLQFSEFDIVGDHYVLAVKSDSYQSQHGPIIERSQSGQTLFVEPYELRKKCDKRIRLLAKIEEIISKICTNFSTELHIFSTFYDSIFTVIHQLDLLRAKSSYCIQHNLVRPKLTEDFQLEIDNFFHPLISKPITNTIILDNTKRGLVISGPNTGGKTVSLKSIAIIHLFMNMGIFIPATSATLSPITNLYFLGNEGQDLSQGLSSFALEAKNYLEMMNNLGDKNLIIIDEIFNSTSSEEASALAISLFDEINNKSSSKFLISTHHQLLKTSIHSNKDFTSAHVGFDLETNLPTYKLYTDGPGSSLAFTIFENLSKQYKTSNNISQNAKNILDQKQVSYDELLQDLSHKRSALDGLITQNQDLNYQLKNQKKSMEGTLFLEKQKSHEQYHKKLQKVLSKAESLFFELKKGPQTTKKKFYNQKSQIELELKQEREESTNNITLIPSGLKSIPIESLIIGQKVYSTEINKEARIDKINTKKQLVQVKVGNIGLWVNASSLYIHHSSLPQSPSITVTVERKVVEKIEHDCRGMRLDAFQKITEDCIEDLLSGSVPYIILIHGHGNGVLKKWLRETLKRSYPEIFWEAPNGNDGSTELKLNS